MPRSRAAAKAAGTRMERTVADFLAEHVDDRIDRQVKTGAKDTGDIGGVRLHRQKIAVEVKDTARQDIAGWIGEAEVERQNLGALAGVVVYKRVGKGQPHDQLVLMTLADFAAILSGTRPNLGQ